LGLQARRWSAAARRHTLFLEGIEEDWLADSRTVAKNKRKICSSF